MKTTPLGQAIDTLTVTGENETGLATVAVPDPRHGDGVRDQCPALAHYLEPAAKTINLANEPYTVLTCHCLCQCHCPPYSPQPRMKHDRPDRCVGCSPFS